MSLPWDTPDRESAPHAGDEIGPDPDLSVERERVGLAQVDDVTGPGAQQRVE